MINSSDEEEKAKIKQDMNNLENRIAGLETILDLRLSHLSERLDSRDNDRTELIDRIKTLEEKVGNISVDVAKLIGKWSLITLILAGFVSLLFSEAKLGKDLVPDVLPPKTELKLDKQDDSSFRLV